MLFVFILLQLIFTVKESSVNIYKYDSVVATYDNNVKYCYTKIKNYLERDFQGCRLSAEMFDIIYHTFDGELLIITNFLSHAIHNTSGFSTYCNAFNQEKRYVGFLQIDKENDFFLKMASNNPYGFSFTGIHRNALGNFDNLGLIGHLWFFINYLGYSKVPLSDYDGTLNLLAPFEVQSAYCHKLRSKARLSGRKIIYDALKKLF
ncbi:hypothetical protein M153_4230002881 [Pseudoloma neurophilia]|uniref:Uncharacterized protein n=1 Tax=Pseudoloma neurophilia TaxID=146866 RepID=A0A0R0M4K8_9MICR|nr:hypothetical protein M153_4230002881 [Pseudoloma neurophilia]